MKLRNYVLVTFGYWTFTLTDGALRMLVLLHFNELGYSPVAIAFLFLAYEFMGIVTNLLGGWVGARRGLNRTLVAGLGLQIVALIALTFEQPSWKKWFAVAFVMAAQAVSGIAKDLTKMSSKSAVKTVAGDGDGALFRLVAILTGSKNALKGVGFFLGAALLSWIGYDNALWAMAAALAVAVIVLLIFLNEDIGKSKKKPPLRSILSKSVSINRLSAARFFLFGSRDIWFVVALPVFALINTGEPVLFLAALVLVFGLAMAPAAGVTASLFSLVFDADVRYSAVSVGYTLSQVVGSAFAPMIAVALYNATKTSNSIAAYLIAVSVISAVSVTLLPGPWRGNPRLSVNLDCDAHHHGVLLLGPPLPDQSYSRQEAEALQVLSGRRNDATLDPG